MTTLNCSKCGKSVESNQAFVPLLDIRNDRDLINLDLGAHVLCNVCTFGVKVNRYELILKEVFNRLKRLEARESRFKAPPLTGSIVSGSVVVKTTDKNGRSLHGAPAQAQVRKVVTLIIGQTEDQRAADLTARTERKAAKKARKAVLDARNRETTARAVEFGRTMVAGTR